MNHVKNNNCEKKNFFNSNLFLILAISFSVLVIGGSITYAFYQSSINGTISGTIARWDFKANNLTDNISLDFGELYPGKNGSVDLVLSAENSDLDVYYELIFSNANNINSKLYWDSNHNRGIGSNGTMTDNSWRVGKYGVIKAGSKETIPIYVYWPYEKRDNYSNAALNSKIKIVGRQYKGYSGSLPINVLNLPFGSFNNSCTRDSFNYAVIGTGCGFGTETIDSTHGYFKY